MSSPADAAGEFMGFDTAEEAGLGSRSFVDVFTTDDGPGTECNFAAVCC